MQSQMISSMMPMIVKMISSHQPVRSRSCSRRTDTGEAQQKKDRRGRWPEHAGRGRLAKVDDCAINDPSADGHENTNSVQHQSSDRAARPANVT
jgi:hypothetical protein